MSTSKERGARREAMYEMIRRYEGSGESQRSFCEKESVAGSTFRYWLRRYREQAQEPSGSFIAIKTVEREPLIELEYPGGLRVRIYS